MTNEHTVYFVCCRYQSEYFFPERTLADASNRLSIINDIISGQIEDVVRVWSVDIRTHESSDESKAFAKAIGTRVRRMIDRYGEESLSLPRGLRDFLEEQLGLGAVLSVAA